MIGTALKKIRLLFDYSASEMSEKLGISRSYLSEIENNVKEPSMRILKTYSEVTGIKLSSLMFLAEQYGDASDFQTAHALTSRLLNSFIDELAASK